MRTNSDMSDSIAPIQEVVGEIVTESEVSNDKSATTYNLKSSNASDILNDNSVQSDATKQQLDSITDSSDNNNGFLFKTACCWNVEGFTHIALPGRTSSVEQRRTAFYRAAHALTTVTAPWTFDAGWARWCV